MKFELKPFDDGDKKYIYEKLAENNCSRVPRVPVASDEEVVLK